METRQEGGDEKRVGGESDGGSKEGRKGGINALLRSGGSRLGVEGMETNDE